MEKLHFCLRTILGSDRNLEHIKKEVGDISLLVDCANNKMGSFISLLHSFGKLPIVILEDDVILCDDFKYKVEMAQQSFPNHIISFHNVPKGCIGKKDAETFNSSVCFYLPKGYGQMISEFYEKWPKKELLDCSALVSDWMKENYLGYINYPLV